MAKDTGMGIWQKMKNEYATTDIGYRELAEKYNVSLRTLANHAKAEKWVEAREHYSRRVSTAALNRAITNASNRINRMATVSDRILDAVEKALDNVDKSVLKGKRKIKRQLVDENTGRPCGNETVEEETIVFYEGVIDVAALKIISDTLRNLKEVYMLRSPEDYEEQKARIEKLRAEAKARDTAQGAAAGETGVLMLPEKKEGKEDECSMDTSAKTD